MKEKCDECVKSHAVATMILIFFFCVIGLCLIIGSYFSEHISEILILLTVAR